MTISLAIQAHDLLRDSVLELKLAIERKSPDAAYWYARTAAGAARAAEATRGQLAEWKFPGSTTGRKGGSK